MAKAPADQFYFSDYLRDTRSLSLAAKGAWMDCLCDMWFSVTRGTISKPVVGYARLFGCTVDQAKQVIDEIADLGIGDATTESNGNIKLTNRRMVREEYERELNRNRQARFRESNGNVTAMSRENNDASSISSSSPSIKPTTTPRARKILDADAIQELKSKPAYSHIDIDSEFEKAATWCEVNNRENTPRFFVNWLNRIQKPLTRPASVQVGKSDYVEPEHKCRTCCDLKRIVKTDPNGQWSFSTIEVPCPDCCIPAQAAA